MNYLKITFLLVCICGTTNLSAQASYHDSLQAYINKYVKNHEVVTGSDKEHFRFFPIEKGYQVIAKFEKAKESKWFLLATSGIEKKMYRIYGSALFTLHDTAIRLNLYQAQNLLSNPEYKDYLVLMFTDKTTGSETYEAGRYIDLAIDDIKNNTIVIDFNKAYNPYCAYVKDKYNCPIPPRENDMPVAIRAGEKIFGKD